MIMWQPYRGLPHFFLKVLFFPFLYIASGVYRAGFVLTRLIQKTFGKSQTFKKQVIGIGNLTVGGTGKSVLAAYLSTLFGVDKCGIVLRGYGAASTTKKGAFFVTKKSNVFSVGDEALMLAQQKDVPIVISRCKSTALKILFTQTTCEIGIVDDAYQSAYLKTDAMILLLDARAPFGNGCQLPAGPLREKDLSRADIIVLTHANRVSDFERVKSTTSVVREGGGRDKIVYACHSFTGVFAQNQKKMAPSMLKKKRFCVIAGIGSPSQFFEMLAQNGLETEKRMLFPDHHDYTVSDLEAILCAAAKMPILTTEKDWVKIDTVLRAVGRSLENWYVVRVSFAWLTLRDEQKFCAQLKKCLGK